MEVRHGSPWTPKARVPSIVSSPILTIRTSYLLVHWFALGPTTERGLYKTMDGGKSWRRILFINDTTGIADMVMDPGNPDKLLVATWQYYCKPWTMYSGGIGSGLHISYDGGESFTKKSVDGIPTGELGRIGLAIAPSKTQYHLCSHRSKENGLYKSTDGGLKWSLCIG